MLIKRSFFLFLFLSQLTISQEKDLNLPNLGDRVSGVISLEQERMLGQGFLEQVYAQAPLINDPIIQEYTELLIYRLSETSQVKDRKYTIVLIDEKSLNAFAAPGGVIGVNGGLFLNAGNEAQGPLDNDKSTVIALREIADEKISVDDVKEDIIKSYQLVQEKEEENEDHLLED